MTIGLSKLTKLAVRGGRNQLLVNPFEGCEDFSHIAELMDSGQIGLQLMDLYGKLRRATNPQVRLTIESRIDELVAAYEREQRAAFDRLVLEQERERARLKR